MLNLVSTGQAYDMGVAIEHDSVLNLVLQEELPSSTPVGLDPGV